MDTTATTAASATGNAPQPVTAQQQSQIITERSGTILRVQLNRLAKKNAMTSGMYAALADILNAAAKDETVRVVVLHGAGDSFTAGNDLEDFVSHPPHDEDNPQGRLIAALIAFDKPLIAAVHGAAVGFGTTMLAHCDFVYAAENTRFQMPFINLGLVMEFGSSYLLPARIGYIPAAELIFLGVPFDAQRAAEVGFVTRVVSDSGLMAVAMETTQALSEKPADALRALKRLFKQPAQVPTEAAVKSESDEFSLRLQSADTKEAIAAFFEKRRPVFNKGNGAVVSH